MPLSSTPLRLALPALIALCLCLSLGTLLAPLHAQTQTQTEFRVVRLRQVHGRVRRSRTSSTWRIAEGSVTFAGPGTTRLCTSCQCWLS